jgi:hypothetical protein
MKSQRTETQEGKKRYRELSLEDAFDLLLLDLPLERKFDSEIHWESLNYNYQGHKNDITQFATTYAVQAKFRVEVQPDEE